eukprot:TRINITY_DN18669_c0_g1_i2.p2 TRINITY_DN18669_c0_g1~~TRINITY_DN18669_c0_g1_i2.p2  ORF type:complete len:105 (+),score=5.19 TRINITY_DN18669_c0_g1_i2:198-512(+)
METKWILTVMLWCCYYAHRPSCPKFICDKESEVSSSCAWKERNNEVLEYHFKACESHKLICDWRFIHEANSQCVEYMAASLYPCLLYTSPSPRDLSTSRMPSSA